MLYMPTKIDFTRNMLRRRKSLQPSRSVEWTHAGCKVSVRPKPWTFWLPRPSRLADVSEGRIADIWRWHGAVVDGGSKSLSDAASRQGLDGLERWLLPSGSPAPGQRRRGTPAPNSRARFGDKLADGGACSGAAAAIASGRGAGFGNPNLTRQSFPEGHPCPRLTSRMVSHIPGIHILFLLWNHCLISRVGAGIKD